MGNEPSLVRDCKLEKEVPVVTPNSWRLYQSKKKDGSRLSVFVYEQSEQNTTSYMDNSAKYLKVLRHPSILKFYGIESTSEGVWLATEQVTPLENVLEHLSSAEIVAGIYNLLEGLVFLHERGGLSHNNLCLSSVFVSDDGSWKLGGLEYLCRFDQVSASYLAKCRPFRNEKALAPEEKAGTINSVDHGWARDVYSFGILMEILLEHVTELGDLTKTFEIRVQDECLDPDPNHRPKLSSFIQDRLFRNDFLQIMNFLKNITMKSEDEKREFFSSITKKLYNLPTELLASRLVHPLLSRFVLLDATACLNVVPHIMTPYKGGPRPQFTHGDVNPLLPESLFKKHVVPELFKIFHVRDAHIRLVLLEHFDCFIDMFDKDVLRNSLLPQLLLGLRDVNDELVRMSLHAVAYLVPLLGGDIVVGAHRLKLFSEAAPKFNNSAISVAAASKHIIPTENGTVEKHTSHSPSQNNARDSDAAPSGRKTLKDLAQEVQRERRREEARKRNEDRRKRREDRDRQTQKAKLVSNKVEKQCAGDANDVLESEHPVDDGVSSLDNNTDDTADKTSSSLDMRGLTESDIDRQIEEELESMDTTLSPTNSNLDSKDGHSSAHSSSMPSSHKGALKLKSSKMRTSPPPKKKPDPSIASSLDSKVDTTQGDGWGDSWGGGADDTETWADGGDDDTWTSTEWGNPNTDSKNTSSERRSSGSKHSNVNSPGSVKPPTPTTSEPAKSGGMSVKTQNKGTTKVPPVIKPRMIDLDITQLDIKTSGVKKPAAEEQEDFFADMAPAIKVDSNSLWGMLNAGADQNKTKTKAKVGDIPSGVERTAPSNFAVANVEQNDVADGWGGDDMDWGEDF